MLPPSARKLKRHRRQHGAVVQHTLRDIKHCVPDPLPAVVRCRAGRSKRSVESSALQSERRILGSSPVGLGPSNPHSGHKEDCSVCEVNLVMHVLL